MRKTGPQGTVLTTNEGTGPQGTDNEVKSVIAATAVPQVQINDSLKNSLHSLLQHESPCAEILEELNGGTKQVSRNSLFFKRVHGILYVNDQNQDAHLDFWRIVVPDNEQMQSQVVQEYHCTPYSAHPGIQRTITRVKRSFWWKGMVGTYASSWRTVQCVRQKSLTTH